MTIMIIGIVLVNFTLILTRIVTDCCIGGDEAFASSNELFKLDRIILRAFKVHIKIAMVQLKNC